MGEQCAQAIDRARARARADRATARLDAVSAASRALAQTLDLDATIETVVRLALEHLGSTIGLSLSGSSPPVVASRQGSSEAGGETSIREMLGRIDRGPIADMPFVLEGLDGDPVLVLPLRIAGSEVGVLLIGQPTIDVRDDDDRQFAAEVARRMARAIENARLYTDRDFVARTLQRSLLPPVLPDVQGLDISALFLPADPEHGIGGDFYDVFEMGDGRSAVVVGDVCGKGVEAATVTGIARRTLRALTHLERPSDALHHLNATLMGESLDDRFCTVALAILEPGGRGPTRATIALAGHPQPQVITAAGAARRVGRPGTLLGITEDVEIVDVELELERGELLLLYTDGIMARHESAADEPVGLMAVIRGTPWPSALDLRDRIEEFLEWESAERDDDVAAVIVRAT
jgi:phosphoserine phosphatase RsbU/P